MKAKLVTRLEMGKTHPEYEPGKKKFMEVGYVIDHPQSFRLVQQGCAIPDDDECEKAANRTHAQQKAAQAAYKRLEKGIQKEDWEAFDNGEIEGYDADGSPIPGPNFMDDDE